MHTFYYAGHTRHDPGQLHQPERPRRNIFYSEIARRGELIVEAIRQADFGPIAPPEDFGLEPIGEVHDYGLINLLQNAYRLITAEGDDAPVNANTFNANTFNVGGPSQHIPHSVWGRLGYYSFDTSSPIFEHTWDVAYWAAQTAVTATAHVLAGEGSTAYALCRPPGHHASANLFGGFCYLNNAAIAANWLAQQGQRVVIVDIDYHHGNGTQAIFYRRNDVMVSSIHADPLHAYPFYWGYADEYGTGTGHLYNYNYPLPAGTGESHYLHTLDEVLERVRLYVPDTLVVSLGVDTAENDPLGDFKLTTGSFSKIGQKFAALKLPTVIIQEGGYLYEQLGANVVAFLNGLTNT
jgi:acetoin utilization deacetylase AcuC-like enzyme